MQYSQLLDDAIPFPSPTFPQSGFIKTGQEEYVIEPLESQVGRSEVNVSLGHLHIMYRPKDFNAASNELQTARECPYKKDIMEGYCLNMESTILGAYCTL